jgi:hypothetical protein
VFLAAFLLEIVFARPLHKTEKPLARVLMIQTTMPSCLKMLTKIALVLFKMMPFFAVGIEAAITVNSTKATIL